MEGPPHPIQPNPRRFWRVFGQSSDNGFLANRPVSRNRRGRPDPRSGFGLNRSATSRIGLHPLHAPGTPRTRFWAPRASLALRRLAHDVVARIRQREQSLVKESWPSFLAWLADKGRDPEIPHDEDALVFVASEGLVLSYEGRDRLFHRGATQERLRSRRERDSR